MAIGGEDDGASARSSPTHSPSNTSDGQAIAQMMCEMRALKQRLSRAEHELGLQGNNSTRTAVMYAEPIVYGTGLDDLPRFICVGVCDVTGWPVGAGN